MVGQKELKDLNFRYDIKQVLEILWKIRDNDKFYFITYGEDIFKKLLTQKKKKKIT